MTAEKRDSVTDPNERSLVVTILAGGSGTRLWPLSRASRPKQLLPLIEQRSMLSLAIARALDLHPEKLIIVCSEELRFFVAEETSELTIAVDIVLEPFGRNTAPAATIASLRSLEAETMLVMPSDHVFSDNVSFAKSVKEAIEDMPDGAIVTFGAIPQRPSPDFGYIKSGHSIGRGFVIDRFIEKPDEKLAGELIQESSVFWNCGIFLYRPKVFVDEMRRFKPDLVTCCENIVKTLKADLQFLKVDKRLFESCEGVSIDYALMEKTESALVFPLDAGWSDLGTWAALHSFQKKDCDANVISGDAFAVKSQNCLIRSDDSLLVALGVQDLVLVSTKDATLVADKSKLDLFPELIGALSAENREELVNNKEVFRPWGKYESLEKGERFQIKKITVNPGQKLSKQMHYHRAEHWIVVSGTAKVTKGDNSFIVGEDQSAYIPLGEIHSLENPGRVPLELIEVQSGVYLGEDDIIRLEDNYGRANPLD